MDLRRQDKANLHSKTMWISMSFYYKTNYKILWKSVFSLTNFDYICGMCTPRFALLNPIMEGVYTSTYNTRVTCSCLAFQFIGCWMDLLLGIYIVQYVDYVWWCWSIVCSVLCSYLEGTCSSFPYYIFWVYNIDWSVWMALPLHMNI